jgi:hypothetical protein
MSSPLVTDKPRADIPLRKRRKPQIRSLEERLKDRLPMCQVQMVSREGLESRWAYYPNSKALTRGEPTHYVDAIVRPDGSFGTTGCDCMWRYCNDGCKCVHMAAVEYRVMESTEVQVKNSEKVR